MAIPVPRDGRLEAPRAVPCRGHAFDEDLLCPCGVTWSEHQARPSRCRLGAQRCGRNEARPEGPPGKAD
ncbi:MAG TPA: hypothetical protein VKB65_11885 [Myxococcota bacterium]|nr:hypothetical protein [Myxococcota bacterium]